MTEALERPQKEAYLYVTFDYPNDQHQKYTDWHSPADVTFTYEPKLGVKVADNTGVFEDKLTKIELPYGDAFTQMLVSGNLPPIYVTVEERIAAFIDSADTNSLTLFRGRVSKVVRNYQGRRNAIVVEALSMKANLQVPLGLLCTQQCVFNFGGIGCGVSLGPLIQTGTFDSVTEGRLATISDLDTAPDATYWRNGYVERNGLAIPIRDWSDGAPTKFLLRDRPPAEWLGEDVHLTPGCDKSKEICESRWDNLSQFGGFGIAMPDYHPNLEG